MKQSLAAPGTASALVEVGANAALSYFRQGIASESKRSASDLVSAADLASEAAMGDYLLTHDSGAGIISEEGARRTGEHQWIIDPIDGTTNFLHGLPTWSVAAARKQAELITHSAIQAPVLGEYYWADDSGAYNLQGKISVAATTPLRSALVRIWCDPHVMEQDQYVRSLIRLGQNSAALHSGGSGSLWMSWLASGRADGFVEYYGEQVGGEEVKAWDWYPGSFLVEQAGGVSLQIGAWRVAASSQSLLDELLDCIV